MNAIMKSQRDYVMNRLEADSSIPSLPYAVDVLLDSLADENMGFAELAEVVSHFPDISARLIFLANSAWASPSQAIVDIERVCARLGFSMVRSISIAMVVSSAFDARRCPGFSVERYWTASLLAARLIPVLHARTRLPLEQSIESVSTAGLLHTIGILWLADNLPEQTSQAFTAVQKDPSLSLRQALQHTIEMDYCLVGACLSHSWKFPPLMMLSMEYQWDTAYSGELAAEVKLVGAAARMVSSMFNENRQPVLEMLTTNLGVSGEDAESLYDFLEVQQSSAVDMARTLFA